MLDEVKLADALASYRNNGDQEDKRVMHDVNAVASILTMRKRQSARNIEETPAIFLTDSYLTAKNTNTWYRKEGGRGIGPIITDVALGNLLFLKNPLRFGNYQIHELSAICYAVLKPSESTWERFVDNVKRLETQGKLSPAESILLRTTDFVLDMLVESSIKGYTEAENLQDVIYSAQHAIKKEYLDIIKSKDDALLEHSVEIDNLSAKVSSLEVETQQKSDRFENLVGLIASAVGKGIFALVGIALIILSLYTYLPNSQSTFHKYCGIAFGILGVVSIITGFTVKGITQWVELKIKEKLGKE